MVPQAIGQYSALLYQSTLRANTEKADFNAKYEQILTNASEITEKQSGNDEWVNFIYKISDGYSMHARYDEASSDENPIMYVELKDKAGMVTSLKIDINKIDPKNATRAEIFALTTHGYKGDGEQLFNKTIGFSYHEGLSGFNNLDLYKNLGNDVLQDVTQGKMNFMGLYKEVSSILFGANDIKAYGRITDMLTLLAGFPK